MSIRHRATAPRVEGAPKLADVAGTRSGPPKVTSYSFSNLDTHCRLGLGRSRHTVTLLRGFVLHLSQRVRPLS